MSNRLRLLLQHPHNGAVGITQYTLPYHFVNVCSAAQRSVGFFSYRCSAAQRSVGFLQRSAAQRGKSYAAQGASLYQCQAGSSQPMKL